MALIVQDDTGLVANANGYITVDYFKAYHDDRAGPDSYSNYDDEAIGRAIVKATDYVDNRFKYVGDRAHGTDVQETQWPRDIAFDSDGRQQTGIPTAVKRAVAEYTMRALTKALDPDPVMDPSGRKVQSLSQSVGEVSKAITYASGGALESPQYPAADRILRQSGLVAAGPGGFAGGEIVRG